MRTGRLQRYLTLNEIKNSNQRITHARPGEYGGNTNERDNNSVFDSRGAFVRAQEFHENVSTHIFGHLVPVGRKLTVQCE